MSQRKAPQAPPETPGAPVPSKWRCMVPGCDIEGVWQDVVEGEEFMGDASDKRGHYWRFHYLQTEADYQRKITQQKARRMEHYRKTGQFLPPEV